MTKRLLIAGDVHDDLEALASFANYAQASAPDYILFTGDFSLRPYTAKHFQELSQNPTPEGVKTFIQSKKEHNGKLIREMKSILDNSEISYFVIPGNYDPAIDDVFGERELHKKTSRIGEAKITGYGGADAFPPQIQFLTQFREIVPFDHQELYNHLCREQPQIILSHNPGRGMLDDMFNGQNVGTPAITQYATQSQTPPKLVVSGHIHEAGPLAGNPKGRNGVLRSRGVTVINPGNLGRFELVNFPELTTKMKFDFGTFSEIQIEEDGTVERVSHYTIKGDDKFGNVRKTHEFE